jgi:hypothetical protein
MTPAPNTRGYMARDLLVCKCVGQKARLAKILNRLRGQRVPKWLRKDLETAHEIATILIAPMIEYRDQLEPDPRDLRGYVDSMVAQQQAAYLGNHEQE